MVWRKHKSRSHTASPWFRLACHGKAPAASAAPTGRRSAAVLVHAPGRAVSAGISAAARAAAGLPAVLLHAGTGDRSDAAAACAATGRMPPSCSAISWSSPTLWAGRSASSKVRGRCWSRSTAVDDIRALRPDRIEEHSAPVFATVRELASALPADVALIGFAGAPWTIALYMIEGRGGTDGGRARDWAYRDRRGSPR